MFQKCMNNRINWWMLVLTVYLTWNYVHLWTWSSWLWYPSDGSGANHKQGSSVIQACPYKETVKVSFIDWVFSSAWLGIVFMWISGKLHTRSPELDEYCRVGLVERCRHFGRTCCPSTFYSKNGSKRLHWNIGNVIPNYTASYHKRVHSHIRRANNIL
jgi:hypothetical protein